MPGLRTARLSARLPVRLLAGWLALLWLALLPLSGCQPDAPVSLQLPQHVYIWQRVWRDSHALALQQSKTAFSALRLLSLQYHASTQGPVWTQAAPDWRLLAADGRPLTLVLRLDGQLRQLPAASELWPRWLAILNTARQHGVVIHQLEIDYDAGRARLPAYRQWLAKLQAEITTNPPPWSAKAVTLSATALPDWLAAPDDWRALCQQVDTLTLQLHSVRNPEQGLFDLALVRQWTEQALALPGCRFYLALPAYDAHLLTTAAGVRVESETPLPFAGQRQRLVSHPATVAAYLQWLGQRLAQLRTDSATMAVQGLVWFRLPLSDDQLSWPYPTLAAVSRQQPLQASAQFSLLHEQGRYELMVHNQGNLSLSGAALRQSATSLQLNGVQCLGGDALPGLTWQQQGSQWQLLAVTPADAQAVDPWPALQPQAARQLGWLRCRQLNLLSPAPQ